MLLEPPNPVHVFVQPGTRNPVAKWHYKHMEIRNKRGESRRKNIEDRRLSAQQPLLLHKHHAIMLSDGRASG